MAELATIARPYAEALFKTGADVGSELDALSRVAADPQLKALADNPKARAGLVFNVIADVLARQNVALSVPAANLLRAVIDNRRIGALPEIAAQYRLLANARGGVFDARVESAFPIDVQQLADLMPALERRFGRRLQPRVVENPELIGGIRVVVGDEVLDTSVMARLQQMKAALSA
jgi:F-type H+-transporting ATPase subunit delta